MQKEKGMEEFPGNPMPGVAPQQGIKIHRDEVRKLHFVTGKELPALQQPITESAGY